MSNSKVDNNAPKIKYVFRWNDGIEVESTWDYEKAGVWDAAIALCRPASMRNASRDDVQSYLEQHGKVERVEL